MIDPFLIENRLLELEKYYRTLLPLKCYSVKELSEDLGKKWAVEHGLQLSIQLLLDIGNHILAGLGISDIEEYRDIVSRLGREEIIPKEFAERISGMAGLRNLLVHEYMEIDPERLQYFLTSHLDDFKQFAAFIKEYLEENK